MRRITATEKFDAAHMLPKHEGKCWNLHGHTWRVEFDIQLDSLASADDGMILDFGSIKEIVDKLDHAFLVAKNAPTDREDSLLAAFLRNAGSKIAYLECSETTAENLAKCLTESVVIRLRGRYTDQELHEACVQCTVWETEKHSASYTWRMWRGNL